MDDFGPALGGADEIVLTDIYAAGEPPLPGITLESFAARVQAATRVPVHAVPALVDVPAFVAGRARPGDFDHHARRGFDRRGRPQDPRGARKGRGMTVRATADRRFRRARVRPVRRRRWRGLVTWRRLGVAAATALTLYVGYGAVTLIAAFLASAGDEGGRPGQRQAVDGRSAGDCQRPAGPQHPDGRPGPGAETVARLRLGRRGDDAPDPAGDRRNHAGRADADRAVPNRKPAVPGGRRRRRDRRARTTVRGSRPADHRRSGLGAAGRPTPRRRGARGARRAAPGGRRAAPGSRATRCRRSTSGTRTTPW